MDNVPQIYMAQLGRVRCRIIANMMNTWHSKSLGDGMLAHEPAEEIQRAFLSLFALKGKPAEMAILTRNESEGRLHCEVIAYFSPTAAEIAEQFDAEPCAKPARAELGLLAGDAQCWSALFDESGEILK